MTAHDLAHLHAAAGMNLRVWSAEEYAALLADPKTIVTTTVAGFAIGSIIFEDAELLLIVVHPDHRRTGQGRQILANFEAAAQARGARTVTLEVSDQNTAARQLYETNAYHKVGQRNNYYKTNDGTSEHALILKKTL